uniref:ral guanine nucleotide dissociation stimulator-like isoform X4 n=1 Tax=Halichoerus grypus TaxID=9711 RepID=UPI001659E42E|nr:ral guanine nucleotide dissociation stimulator-like isoform X4 [Halichoerus grypus]
MLMCMEDGVGHAQALWETSVSGRMGLTRLSLDVPLTMPSIAKMATEWLGVRWGHPLVPRHKEGDVEAWCGKKGRASDSVPHMTSPRALSPMLHTWADQYLQEDWQTLHHPWLKLMVAYIHASLTGLDLKCCDPLSMVHLEHLVPTEAEKEVPAPVPQPAAKSEQRPTLDLEHVPALFLLPPLVMEPPSTAPVLEQEQTSALAQMPSPELESAGYSAIFRISSPPLKVDTEPAPASEASCPWHVTSENSPAEEKPELMAFPPQLVAEQLTIIDVELFKKVVPSHRLGSTWSKRNKPGNEHLAPTVRATITHFQSVTSCVLTTCLGNLSMTAQDRARVVEHWIQVAQECQILKNYSSLHAILSALQNTSICRLKNTWRKVSRKNYKKFKKLQSQDKSLSRELMTREAPSKFVTQEINTQKTQERQQQQQKGGEINLRKRNEEYEIMREILLLQVAANNYNLNPNEQFGAWF